MPVKPGVEEVALAFTADAWARPLPSEALTVAGRPGDAGALSGRCRRRKGAAAGARRHRETLRSGHRVVRGAPARGPLAPRAVAARRHPAHSLRTECQDHDRRDFDPDAGPGAGDAEPCRPGGDDRDAPARDDQGRRAVAGGAPPTSPAIIPNSPQTRRSHGGSRRRRAVRRRQAQARSFPRETCLRRPRLPAADVRSAAPRRCHRRRAPDPTG